MKSSNFFATALRPAKNAASSSRKTCSPRYGQTVQRERHLALLPPTKLAADKNGNAVNSLECLLKRLRPSETGREILTIEKSTDAARLQQFLNSSHRCSVGCVKTKEKLA